MSNSPLSNLNTISYQTIYDDAHFANICKPLSNGTWIINKGFTRGVVKGYIYSIPNGNPDPIYDPITHELIGKHQFELARLKVDCVYENYSLCHIISQVDEGGIPYENVRKDFSTGYSKENQVELSGEFKHLGTQVTRV